MVYEAQRMRREMRLEDLALLEPSALVVRKVWMQVEHKRVFACAGNKCCKCALLPRDA